MGWTSPINTKLNDTSLSPLDVIVTTDQISWIGSLLTVGAIFGEQTFNESGLLQDLYNRWLSNGSGFLTSVRHRSEGLLGGSSDSEL